MPGGRWPKPGGWNRIRLEAEVDGLREADVRFRNESADDRGGRQILVEDPSRNPVELLQPA